LTDLPLPVGPTTSVQLPAPTCLYEVVVAKATFEAILVPLVNDTFSWGSLIDA